jgi:restriction endonuclease S subunit
MSTVPFVSKANLERVVIPVPPLARQRELAVLGRLIWQYSSLTRRKLALLEQVLGREFSGAKAQEVA